MAQSSPTLAAALVVITIVQGAAPAVVAVQTGRIISLAPEAIRLGYGSSAAAQAKAALAVTAVAIIASEALGPFSDAALFGLSRRFQASLSRLVMAGATALPGIAHFEDSSFRDRLEVSDWIGWAPVATVRQFAPALQLLVQYAALAAVAANYHIWLPIVVTAASVPAGIAALHFEGAVAGARVSHAGKMRGARYYRLLALRLESAKELRILGLKDFVLERQSRYWLEALKGVWDLRRGSLRVLIGFHVAMLATVAVSYLSVIRAATNGSISVGTFVACFLAVTGMFASAISGIQQLAWIRSGSSYLPAAFAVSKMASRDPRLEVRGTRSAHGLIPKGICFDDVSFTYPGAKRPSLESFDLLIPAGSSLALVGENGAGKTTVVKLLCRFYDPTQGRILLDGVDIREFDLDDLRRRLSVVFQDFVHYPVSAGDNIGFGCIERLGDKGLLGQAATRAGILEKILALQDGWETPLRRDFGGVDLSGGEWQRVALARAMATQLGRGSDVLILDEPTASLDVRLEHELFGRFSELTKGNTTLLVSHRFSTVRMAQRIAVIEGGWITEQGSHEELMASGNLYAELYRLQASHYSRTAGWT